METLNEIFSAFKLNNFRVSELSQEAKAFSSGCGMKGVFKELQSATWNLFDDISDKLWYSPITNVKKITLGFELFETFPSYFHFLVPFYRGVCNKEIVDENEKELIWTHFMKYLASEDYYADPVGYVLWVEFFEDGSTVEEAWEGLIKNHSNIKSLLRLLEHAGPVPYELKEPVYEKLLKDRETHQTIFNSLLYSAYDVFGKIDKPKTLTLLTKLEVDTTTENYISLKEKLK